MEITVNNSTTAATLVTVFAELQDGRYVAKVLPETDVPYTPYFDNELDQVIVYIAPDEEQLAAILTALNEKRLPFGDLQNYGAAGGGTSTIPV
jgi:hypothetical protein